MRDRVAPRFPKVFADISWNVSLELIERVFRAVALNAIDIRSDLGTPRRSIRDRRFKRAKKRQKGIAGMVEAAAFSYQRQG